MINTVVLDIGMVLVDFVWEEYLKSMGFSPEVEEKVKEAVFNNPVWNEFDRGVWTDEEIINEMCQSAPDYEADIRHLFAGPVEQMIREYPFAAEWVQELKSLGCRVLLLSNFGDTLFHKVNLEFVKYVDGGVISYEAKCIKPDPQIYRIIMERCDIVPEETVFVDDRPENVQAARDFGWHGIVATDHDAVLRGLQTLEIASRAGAEE